MVERISGIAARWGVWPLLICAFADASLVPMPVTAIFMIFIISNSQKVLKYTTFVILGTLAGSLAGYFIGHFAWLKPNGDISALAQFIADNIPGFSVDFYMKYSSLFNKWNIWVLSLAGATPIPYGFFSIASGIFNINVFAFGIITLVSQSAKFVFLALISSKFRYELNRLKILFFTRRIKGKTV